MAAQDAGKLTPARTSRATGPFDSTSSSLGRVADVLSEILAHEDLNDVREPLAAITRGLHAYAANLAAI